MALSTGDRPAKRECDGSATRVRLTRTLADSCGRCVDAGRYGYNAAGRVNHATFGLARRRRSRTYQPMGYIGLPVLKTGWATGPVPLQEGGA
jgi:hypothetical protein